MKFLYLPDFMCNAAWHYARWRWYTVFIPWLLSRTGRLGDWQKQMHPDSLALQKIKRDQICYDQNRENSKLEYIVKELDLVGNTYLYLKWFVQIK